MGIRRIAASGLVALVVVGCAGSGPEPAYEVLDEGALASSAPAADAVLTVAAAGGPTAGFTHHDLEAARTVELTVFEPFVKREVRFTGVPLQDLIDVAALPPDATTLHMVALNDYRVDVPVDVLRHPDVIVATHADGRPIPVDEGGTIRLVLGDAHPDAANEALWIWSLASIEYR